ncbi:MAG: Cytochrome c oxidase subunit 5A [Heterodermia speciosa]|uniref:Cytochrome c oxidase polypeptide V n=1 Tax=Heterodermia speciosa TaxID=116794 RepID=A0A8H3IUV1_9LECA|nr:MAG: Cytochrome c oxidase subunit 5A [Heterodermia speciosa]
MTMLRSLPRAGNSSLYLRPCLRTTNSLSRSPKAACTVVIQQHQTRPASSAHAISNPTLAGIEKRWEEMPPQEQADLWMALRDRMKIDWHDLTLQEKKAAYWIAFGPHGPRALEPEGQAWLVVKGVAAAVAVSAVLFVIIRSLARPAPKTMTAQYQEMTNEYLRGQNVEPITGLSSEGYKGKGMVQSKPRKGPPPSDDDE